MSGGDGLLHGCSDAFPGPNSFDRKSADSPGTAISSVSIPGTRASAYQTAGGFDAAAAQARSDAVNTELGAASSAFLDVSILNTGPDPVPISIRFLITHAELSLNLATDFRAFGERYAIAEVVESVAKSVSGGPFGETTLWTYVAELVGVNAGVFGMPFSEFVLDPQGIGNPAVTVDRSIGVAHVELAPFAGHLSLGDLAPGTGATIRYDVAARVFTGRPNLDFSPPGSTPTTDVVAWIEDPFGLDGDLTLPPFLFDRFFINDQSLASLLGVPESPPSGAPLPATLLLFAGAIGCVALTRRLRGSGGRLQGAHVRRARRASAQPIG
jgi:hypothetical protein